jgi:hypothetical protein
MTKIIAGLLVLFWATFANAATYYIDHSGGADTNNGTAKITPWAHAPGMADCSNTCGTYSHANGDIFIFKGGETWTAPASNAHLLTIANSGVEGSSDQYTTDRTWYTGGYWSQPIFAGTGAMEYQKALIYALYKSYILINDIKFTAMGTSGISNSGYTVNFNGGRSIEISYCTFAPYNAHGIVYWAYPTRTDSKLYIHHNDFSLLSNVIEIGSPMAATAADNTFDDIKIYNNTVHDTKLALLAGDHGDGFHIYGWNFATDGAEKFSFSNVLVYNNRFYGDFSSGDGTTTNTAMIYFGEGTNGAWIYNNVLTFDNTTGTNTGVGSWELANGFLYINRVKNIYVYNNTMSGESWVDPDYGAKYCILIRDSYNVTLTNNIMSQCWRPLSFYAEFWTASSAKTLGTSFVGRQQGGSWDAKIRQCTTAGTTGSTEPDWATNCPNDADTCTDGGVTWTTRSYLTASNRNNIYPRTGQDSVLTRYSHFTFTEWKAEAGSYDANSIATDPVYTSTTGEKDLTLQATSLAINAGANLSGTFTTDITGATRGLSWDIGAYEYGAGGGDPDLPTLTSATIGASGILISLLFSEAVTHNTETGWTITMIKGALTMAYSSGSGTNTLVYTLSRAVKTGETGTVAWTAAANTIEDTSGNDLATIASAAVTNDSTDTGATVTLH